ncbi:MAG: chemotaxis-specific protein-glutamate methyltransferase CheB [Nitrospinae bacterium]|nr:chemotaxis-specific protein-glutamate methyltransferase CheB [Nitrospinota bacterium]
MCPASRTSLQGGGVIKVLLVDDSIVAQALLKKMLSTSPDISVVGSAHDGEEALSMIPVLDPDVIITDIHMPRMDGLKFTETVMDKFPRPILVVSVSVERNSVNVFRMLQSGAIDVFPKPKAGGEEEFALRAGELISKVRILAGVHVMRRKEGMETHKAPLPSSLLTGGKAKNFSLVAIGASTGGPQALYEILSRLPRDFSIPVICVQHISDGFIDGMVEWLQTGCQLEVRKARHGEIPLPGNVYFPGEGAHLIVDSYGAFRYLDEPPVNGHRPSITLAFKSIAREFGSGAIGVLLTGMGNDGAEGLKTLDSAGAVTIAQDADTCVVFGMPKSAIDIGAAQYVLPLEEIAPAIILKIAGEGRK